MLRPLPTAYLEWLFPGIEAEPINIQAYENKIGNMPLHDLAQLCYLARHLRPKVIFEIGTFEGNTTLQLALNTEAEIWTLDLPPNGQRPVQEEGLDVYPAKPGVRFHGSPVAPRIHQLFGDSQTFDFSPWYGKADLVFVDAAHHFESVKKDTETALRLLAPLGLIAWHDYASWAPEVVRALDETLDKLPLMHLTGTSLALHSSDPARAGRWQFEWVRKDLYSEMESHLQVLNNAYQQLQQDHQALEKRFQGLENEHDEAAAQLLRLQQDHQELQVRNHELRVRRDEMRARMEAAEIAQQKLTAERDELATAYQRLTRLWGLVRALPGAAARSLRLR